MITISTGPGGEAMHMTVLVAFDRISGEVHATFVHGSLEPGDMAGLARSREHLLADVAARPGRERARLDILEMPLHELPTAPIERVDPATRRVVTKPARQPSGLTLP